MGGMWFVKAGERVRLWGGTWCLKGVGPRATQLLSYLQRCKWRSQQDLLRRLLSQSHPAVAGGVNARLGDTRCGERCTTTRESHGDKGCSLAHGATLTWEGHVLPPPQSTQDSSSSNTPTRTRHADCTRHAHAPLPSPSSADIRAATRQARIAKQTVLLEFARRVPLSDRAVAYTSTPRHHYPARHPVATCVVTTLAPHTRSSRARTRRVSLLHLPSRLM